MLPQPDDKVRIKSGEFAGHRGVVQRVFESTLLIRLDDPDKMIEAEYDETTNFSMAARKAWARMPDRRVGRPKGTKTTDRVSVTLRIDRELWEAFQNAEAAGAIEDRTATINAWIATRLRALRKKE